MTDSRVSTSPDYGAVIGKVLLGVLRAFGLVLWWSTKAMFKTMLVVMGFTMLVLLGLALGSGRCNLAPRKTKSQGNA